MNRGGSYHGYTLYETASRFIIEPRDRTDEVLVIDRQSVEISINRLPWKHYLPQDAKVSYIEGIIGIKRLLGCSYLIVATESTFIGTLLDRPVYKLEHTQVIPIDLFNKPIGEQHKWEDTYLKMLESVLKTPNFYFSRTYDLTNNLQTRYPFYLVDDPRSRSYPIEAMQHYNRKFLWNGHLMSDFERCDPVALQYILPLIMGFISINDGSPNQGVKWALVSRRSVNRAGTRFNRRGADYDGNVANFVETEQIMEKSGLRTSFVQLRGSIPLIWSQTPKDYRYKPSIEIHNDDHELVMKRHFGELKNTYQNVSVVSLIDSRGHEGALAHEFNQRMAKIQEHSNIPYHYFDFHKECSKMRWHRLEILIERLENELQAYGFFVANGEHIIQRQSGVIRSNCIDSLDRTNVVQSMIGLKVMERQHQILQADEAFIELKVRPVFMETFKNVWADNADALSIQYAGTPALKTDFTRTGRRTHQGMLRDGINSLTRYVSNSFFDDYRQDSIDLFLGNYEGYPSPLYRPLDVASYTSSLSLTIVMLTLVALFFYFRWE